VDSGSRRPVAVAVPLGQVDLAADDRMVIRQPPGGPAPVGEAVELDSGFPGGADAAPPRAVHLAARVLAVVSGSADDEIGVAVEEHVLAIVTVLPHVLGLVPEHRVLDRLPRLRHYPLRRIGGRARPAIELVMEQEPGRLGGGTAGGGTGLTGPSGRPGSAPAIGTGIAAASRPIPVINVTLRRFVSGTALNDKAARQAGSLARLAP
jgi:hypothetical protein